MKKEWFGLIGSSVPSQPLVIPCMYTHYYSITERILPYQNQGKSQDERRSHLVSRCPFGRQGGGGGNHRLVVSFRILLTISGKSSTCGESLRVRKPYAALEPSCKYVPILFLPFFWGIWICFLLVFLSHPHKQNKSQKRVKVGSGDLNRMNRISVRYQIVSS